MVVVVVVSWFFLLSLFKKGHFIFLFRFYPAVSYTTRVLCIFLNLIPNNTCLLFVKKKATTTDNKKKKDFLKIEKKKIK